MAFAIAPFPIVVAKKGVKGFFKTRRIDENTTICDIRLKTYDNMWQCILSLSGKLPDSSSGELQFATPCRLLLSQKIPISTRTRIDIDIGQSTLFKLIKTGKFEQDGDTGTTVFEGVILDNYNNAYTVKCSSDGVFCRVVRVQTLQQKQKEAQTQQEATVIKLVPQVVETRARTVPLRVAL